MLGAPGTTATVRGVAPRFWAAFVKPFVGGAGFVRHLYRPAHAHVCTRVPGSRARCFRPPAGSDSQPQPHVHPRPAWPRATAASYPVPWLGAWGVWHFPQDRELCRGLRDKGQWAVGSGTGHRGLRDEGQDAGARGEGQGCGSWCPLFAESPFAWNAGGDSCEPAAGRAGRGPTRGVSLGRLLYLRAP